MKNTLFVCRIRRLTQLFVLLLSFIAIPSYAVETITHYHTDSLGSPVAGTDSNGVLLWKEDYKPYGERIRKQVESDKNTRWYTGHPEDKETGLTYAGARFYDSVTGRFLAIDSVGFVEDNIHSFSRYTYVNNNPYKYIDPDGNYLDLVVEAASIGVGVNSFNTNLNSGNYWAAAADAVGVVGDTILAAIPGVPGAIGLGIQASRKGADAVAGGVKATKKQSKVKKSKNTVKIGDKFTKTTEVRPGNGPGQSRAEYTRYKNSDGKVIRSYKDSYDRGNKYRGRKPLRGGPEGRPQNQ